MVSARAAVAVLLCLGFAGMGAAPAVAAAPNITLTATGTFASPPISGADTLKLAGEPFTIAVVASAAQEPVKHGPYWAVFSPLKMTGIVHSGLLGSTPVSIASGAASIEQIVVPVTGPDEFVLGVPVKIIGISLTINATITLPPGTLPNQLIHTFGPVSLSPSTTTVIYSDGITSTTLAIATGTLQATSSTGSTAKRVTLRGK